MPYRSKLILVFTAAFALMTLAGGASFHFFIIERHFRDQAQSKGQFLADTFAASMREPIVKLYAAVLVTNIETLFENNEDLVYVFVYDREGNLMVSKTQEGYESVVPIPSDEKRSRCRIEIVDVGGREAAQCEVRASLGGWDMATFFIAFSKESVNREIQNLWRALSAIMLGGLLIGGGVSMWISGPLTSSLGRLTAAVKEIHKGDFHPEISIRTGDEFQLLGDTVAEMGASIEEKIALIHDKNRELSDRLEELTGLSRMAFSLSGKLQKKMLSLELARGMKELFAADRACVFSFVSEDGVLRPKIEALERFGPAEAVRALEELDLGPASSRWSGSPTHASVGDAVALPVYVSGRVDGVALAVGVGAAANGNGKTQSFFETLSAQVGLAFENSAHYEEAVRDGLTGLYVQNYFKRQVDRLVEAGRPFALLMMDIDFFKKVNDTWGHQAGDDVLRRVADMAARKTTSKEVAARYGGEEFGLLLPDAGEQTAREMAEDIRAGVEGMTFESQGKPFKCTMSLGVSFWPEDAVTGFEAIKKADEALYYAKKHGRNQWAVYRECCKDVSDSSSSPG